MTSRSRCRCWRPESFSCRLNRRLNFPPLLAAGLSPSSAALCPTSATSHAATLACTVHGGGRPTWSCVHSSLTLPTERCARTAAYGSTAPSTTRVSSGGLVLSAQQCCVPQLCSSVCCGLFDLTVRSLPALPVVQIHSPSNMSPRVLAAEVLRCTRADSSIGLASLCAVCHREAERSETPSRSTPSSRSARARARARARRRDIAAKISRRECECDEKCHRVVTAAEVGMFEWDHRVQSFDDPDYCLVSSLVSNGCSAERCDRERAKCRLLHVICHRAHTTEQQRMRAAQRCGS
jgi:hypothetical protein